MGLNNFGLGILFQATDNVTKPASDVDKALNRTATNAETAGASASSALADIGAAFGGVAAAIGPGLVLKSLADDAGKFEQGLVVLKGTAGATANEMKELRRAAIDAGIATQFSPVEAVDGLNQIASRGFNAAEQMRALLPTLDLAAARQLDVGESAGIAAATMKIYGIDVDDLGFALDRLNRITQKTGIQSADLRVAVANSAKGAIAAKQGFTEMLVVMGLARNTGLDMGIVANSMNRALSSISTRGKKELDKLGIEIEDSKGRFRDFGDILLDVSAKTDNMSDATRAATLQQIFGQFGMTASLAVMKQLSEGIKNNEGVTLKGAAALQFLRDELDNSSGGLAKLRDEMLATFDGQKTLLQGTLQTFRIVLGEPLARLFRPVVGAVTGTLNRILAWFDGLDEATKDTIARWAVLATTVIAGIGAFVALKAVIPLLIPVFVAVKGILISLVASLWSLALPIVAAIGVVLILRKVWEENWGDIQGKTEQAINNIVGFVTRLGKNLDELWKGFKSGFNDTINDLQSSFDKLDKSFDNLVTSIFRLSDVLGITSKASDDLGVSLTGDWWEDGATSGRVFAIALGLIAEALTLVNDFISFNINKLAGFVEFFKIVNVAVFSFFAETIPKAVQTGLAWIGSFIDTVQGWVNGLIAEMMDSIVRLARRVPEALRVGPIKAIAELKTQNETGVAGPSVAVGSGRFRFDAEQRTNIRGAVGQLTAATAARPTNLQSRVVVELDGEVLAEAVANQSSEAANMSFAGGP